MFSYLIQKLAVAPAEERPVAQHHLRVLVAGHLDLQAAWQRAEDFDVVRAPLEVLELEVQPQLGAQLHGQRALHAVVLQPLHALAERLDVGVLLHQVVEQRTQNVSLRVRSSSNMEPQHHVEQKNVVEN